MISTVSKGYEPKGTLLKNKKFIQLGVASLKKRSKVSFENSMPPRNGGCTVFFQGLLLGDNKDLQRCDIRLTTQCCVSFD